MRLAMVAFLAVFVFAGCAEDQAEFEYQTHTAKVGDLRITIRQKGTIEARDPFAVQNPIEGRSEILELAEEGTYVKKGDFLFSLDVSSQEDAVLQQRISTSNSEQTLFNATQQLEITKQQNESDTKKGELNILFAELDMQQYLEGDLPREIESVESEITLSTEEQERAKETIGWSEKLAVKGYISSDRLKADRLLLKRREIEEKLARSKMLVLNKYTSKKRKRELESELEEAKRELERIKVRCQASARQKEADVKARDAQYELEKKKLARLEHSVTNNKVVSPRDGIVIHAREGGRRDRKPLEAGSQVRKGQTILELPDMDRVLVDVDVHESSVHMVKLDMTVIITTDTGETIVGLVESVATIADSQSWYRNPDLKVYSTKVTIDNPGRKLKPGMNCYAEVIIEELKSIISIPTQSVYDNGQKTFCYVKVDGKPVLREIEVGLNNTEAIHVKSGIKEGEEVFLAVPDDAPPVPLASAKRKPIDVTAIKAKADAEKAKSKGATKKKGAPKKGGSRRGGTPAERKAMMEKWRKNATPEQIKQMDERMKKRGASGDSQ